MRGRLSPAPKPHATQSCLQSSHDLPGSGLSFSWTEVNEASEDPPTLPPLIMEGARRACYYLWSLGQCDSPQVQYSS